MTTTPLSAAPSDNPPTRPAARRMARIIGTILAFGCGTASVAQAVLLLVHNASFTGPEAGRVWILTMLAAIGVMIAGLSAIDDIWSA
jgi:hypothetical protein